MRTPSMFCLLVAALAAQDAEPTLARAAAAAARVAADELPWRAPEARALRVIAADAGSRAAAEATARALAAKGFRLAREAGDGVVEATVEVSRTREGRTLTLRCDEANAFAARCEYGAADWVDARSGRDLVIEGPEAADRGAALDAARRALERTLAERFPTLYGVSKPERAVRFEPAERFVAARGEGAERVYRAYLRAPVDLERAERLEAKSRRHAARIPWIRGAVVVGAAAVCFGLFRCADWITRGWRTRTLAVLFGSLFVAIVFGLGFRP